MIETAMERNETTDDETEEAPEYQGAVPGVASAVNNQAQSLSDSVAAASRTTAQRTTNANVLHALYALLASRMSRNNNLQPSPYEVQSSAFAASQDEQQESLPPTNPAVATAAVLPPPPNSTTTASLPPSLMAAVQQSINLFAGRQAQAHYQPAPSMVTSSSNNSDESLRFATGLHPDPIRQQHELFGQQQPQQPSLLVVANPALQALILSSLSQAQHPAPVIAPPPNNDLSMLASLLSRGNNSSFAYRQPMLQPTHQLPPPPPPPPPPLHPNTASLLAALLSRNTAAAGATTTARINEIPTAAAAPPPDGTTPRHEESLPAAAAATVYSLPPAAAGQQQAYFYPPNHNSAPPAAAAAVVQPPAGLPLPNHAAHISHKKPADRPKRPLTAYNFFFKDQRRQLLTERQEGRYEVSSVDWMKRKGRAKPHGKIKFTELGPLIGKRWKGLDESKRAYYKELAAEDKRRYKEEMALFIAQEQEELEATRVALEQSVPNNTRKQYFGGPKRDDEDDDETIEGDGHDY